MEAIQIKLTGEIAKYYDVYYRVNAQQFGWMGWAKNGQSSGTSGFGFQLEAIQIKLVKKGGKAPGTTNNGFRDGLKKYVDKRGKGLIKGSKQKTKRAFDLLNREGLSQCVHNRALETGSITIKNSFPSAGKEFFIP